MKKLLSDGTILVGHSLNNDLRGKCREHFCLTVSLNLLCLLVFEYMKGMTSVELFFLVPFYLLIAIAIICSAEARSC